VNIETHHVYVMDELQPQIGCGWRLLDVKVGRKWVHVSTHQTKKYKGLVPKYRKKISLKKWREINGD
jgi:hypothetical protein